jgi:cytochrome oxidase assembly protein ShyY1
VENGSSEGVEVQAVPPSIVAACRRSWRLRLWLLVLLALGGLGVWLGIWQWQKAEARQNWQVLQDTLPLLTSFDGVDWRNPTPWLGREVAVRAVFRPDFIVYLDNQTVAGRPGVDVLGVVTLADGRALLVNRGWLSWPERQRQPQLQHPAGAVLLRGQLYPPSRPGLELGAYPPLAPGVRLPWVDTVLLSEFLGVELPAAELRLASSQPDLSASPESATALLAHWQFTVMSADRHRGYAWQWWALTLMTWGYALWLQRHPRQFQSP